MNNKLINVIILFDCLTDNYDCNSFLFEVNEYFDTELNICDYMETISQNITHI